MTGYTPFLTRSSKKEAEAMLKQLKKSKKLGVDTTKPKFKISKEKVNGKPTSRYVISQDTKSLKRRQSLGL